MVGQQKGYQMNILENKILCLCISLSKIITKICVICNCPSKYFKKETQYIYKLVYFGKFKYVYKLAFAFFSLCGLLLVVMLISSRKHDVKFLETCKVEVMPFFLFIFFRRRWAKRTSSRCWRSRCFINHFIFIKMCSINLLLCEMVFVFIAT